MKKTAIRFTESVDFEGLKQLMDFLETYYKMLVLQNKVIYDFVVKCKSPTLFETTKELHLLNTQKMEIIISALKMANELTFKLLDYGASPEGQGKA